MNIKIEPDLVLTTLENETLLEALVRNPRPLDNVCNGRGTCSKCKVRILNGIPLPSTADRRHLTDAELQKGIRLACSVIPQEGMTVKLDFTEGQDRKERVNLNLKFNRLNSWVGKIHLKSDAPSLADASVALALADLKTGRILKVLSAENAQIACGADVISRLTFARQSQENLAALGVAVRTTINQLLTDLCRP